MPRRRIFLWHAGAIAARGMSLLLGVSQARAAAPGTSPRKGYFTEGELALISSVAREVLPEQDVLDGSIDVARNVDSYLSRFPRHDLGPIRKGIRFLNREITYLLARLLGQATALDRTSVSKYLVTLGYYGDANGEADLPEEKRRIWPRIGYRGPRPEGFADQASSQNPIDESLLVDRLAGKDPLSYLRH